MTGFDETVLAAAEQEREIELTTFGRVTTRPTSVVIWITPLDGKLYIRSGRGMGRDWTQNLAAHGKAVLNMAGMGVPVMARHVTDLREAKAVTRACADKYGIDIATAPDDTPTPAETATFEVMPVGDWSSA